MTKIICPGDNNAHVEFDAKLKKFSAIIGDVEFFNPPAGLEYVNADFNEDQYRIQLSFLFSGNQITDQNQLNEFRNLLNQLNEYSFSNKFYLSRVDFFDRQSQQFFNLVFDPNNERRKGMISQIDNSYSGNLSF